MILLKIQSKNKLKSSDQKLIASLPEGHPERIQKEGLKKEPTTPGHDGEGGIKIENIETVNDANAEKALLEQEYARS